MNERVSHRTIKATRMMRLFNTILGELRDTMGVRIDTFKRKLNKWLLPIIDNYKPLLFLQWVWEIPCFGLDVLTAQRGSSICSNLGPCNCFSLARIVSLQNYTPTNEISLMPQRLTYTIPMTHITYIVVGNHILERHGEQLSHWDIKVKLKSRHNPEFGNMIPFSIIVVVFWYRSTKRPCDNPITDRLYLNIHERCVFTDFWLGGECQREPSNFQPVNAPKTMCTNIFGRVSDSNFFYLHEYIFQSYVKQFYGFEDSIEDQRFRFSEKTSGPAWKRRQAGNSSEDFEEMIGPHARNLLHSGDYSSATIDELCKQSSEEINKDFIVEILRHISKQPEGAVLVFLPGWAQISDIHKLIQNDRALSGRNHLVIPLHSMMPTANQREVFDRPPKGVRKIVLATNIAETSITIDDVVYVVDCGKIKMKKYDKETNLQTLLPEWVTLANAHQRRGRAGRVQAGICYHLFSRAREMILEEYPLPEMLRTRLEEIILHIKILKLGLAKPFLSKVLQPPDEEVVDSSIKMLHCIGALDDAENLTPLGFHLAQLPVDPLMGRMLLMSAIFSCVSPILTIAATLSFKHPFMTPLGKEKLVDEKKRRMSRGSKSDHLMFAYAYQGWEEACQHREGNDYSWRNFLSNSILSQLKNMRKQFLGYLHEKKFVNTTNPEAKEINRNSSNIALVRAIITSGLYPNVARVITPRRKNPNKFQRFRPLKILTAMEKRGVALHPQSVNEQERDFESCWIMYREKIKSAKIYIHDATMVPNYPLLFFGQKLSYSEKDGVIIVDDFVRVKCDKNVATLVQSLRNELDKLLEYKISHSGMTQWDKGSKEGALLHTIVDLISSETVSNEAKYDTYYEDQNGDYEDDY
ncbi:unnamed protein product, partial [Meganyctiphanes norvegica]